MQRVKSADLPAAAVSLICEAVSTMFSVQNEFDPDDLRKAISSALGPDMHEFAEPGFYRVLAAVTSASRLEEGFGVDSFVRYFTLDGVLRHTINPSYVKASLLVPVYAVRARSGEEYSSFEPAQLAAFTKSIESGVTPEGGIPLH